MVIQVSPPGEGLLTYLTHKVLDSLSSLVPEVQPLVVGKVGLVSEGFPTNVASEGFFSRVSSHVGGQIVLTVELLLAN